MTLKLLLCHHMSCSLQERYSHWKMEQNRTLSLLQCGDWPGWSMHPNRLIIHCLYRLPSFCSRFLLPQNQNKTKENSRESSSWSSCYLLLKSLPRQTSSDRKIIPKQLTSLNFPFLDGKVFVFPDFLSRHKQGSAAHGPHCRSKKNGAH